MIHFQSYDFEIKAGQTVTAADATPSEGWIALNPIHGLTAS